MTKQQETSDAVETETQIAKSDGRDLLGRFTFGNPGGPGNPFAAQMARHRQAFLEVATPEMTATLTRKLIEMALAGDLEALKLLLEYAP